VGNRSTSGTAGVGYGDTYNCIVWGNTKNGVVDNYFLSTSGWVIAYTCTTPLPSGTGNIASDPQFLTNTEGDYRLHARSPCLNVGNNGYVLGSTDVLGRTRIQSVTVDMGAYEGAYRWPQTITFPQLADLTYGDGPITLSATASSGRPVIFAAIPPTVVTNISGTVVKIIGAGAASVFALQLGNTDYEPVTVSNRFTVNKATLTVRAPDAARTYGSANPGFTNTYSGFVNGESANVIDTRPTASTTANLASQAGDYPIIPSGGADNNYTFQYQEGTLKVSPRALIIKAANRTKTYGGNLDLGTRAFTTSGLITNLGDSVSAVVLSSDGASATAGIGSYPIRASDASGNRLSNYAITYTNGTLTVDSAPLTVTAQDQFKLYGAAFAFRGTEFTTAGLAAGDAVTSVTLDSAGSATDAEVGTYVITPSLARGSGLANYNVTYAAGTFSVGVPGITFKPPDGTRFVDSVAVTLACPAPNTSIRYTLDGSEPDQDSMLYTNALEFSATATICARAFSAVSEPGAAQAATYTRLYSLSVTNGTASGAADLFCEAGASLSLAAHPAPQGSIFGWWSVTPLGTALGDLFAPGQTNTLFTMPAQLLALAAIYVPDPGKKVGYADVWLTDATTGLPLEGALWSTEGSTWYPQGLCPMKPRLVSFRFASADLHWLAPANQRIRVNEGKITRVTAAFTRVAVVSGAVEGSGSVSLVPTTGQVLPGKTVALIAKTAKGHVFVQWSDGVRTASRAVAPDVDTLYTAVFRVVTHSDGTSTYPHVTLDGADAGIVGVSFPFAQVAPLPLPAKFSAKGLPPGLSIDRNTGVISGSPKKAGTYEAAVSVTGPDGEKGTVTQVFSIVPLPAAAQGSFSGVLFEGGSTVCGTLKLSVSSRGVLRSTVKIQSANLAFAGTCWDSESNGVFTAVLHTSKGESLALTLDTGLSLWDLGLGGNLSGGSLGAGMLEVRGQRNAFFAKTSKDYAAAAQVLDTYKGRYSVALAVAEADGTSSDGSEPQGSGQLTFVVKDGGKVTLAGLVSDGTALSGATTLIVYKAGTPDEFAYVPLFFPLYGRRGSLAGLLAIDPGATASPADNTVVPASGDTAPITWSFSGKGHDPQQNEAPFNLEVDASGGFIDTPINLNGQGSNR